MGRIDESLLTLATMPNKTERAFQLAGLISTLFKIRGVMLVVTGELAFNTYADANSDNPELELATLAGQLDPRMVLDIMRGQLHGRSHLGHWKVIGLTVRLRGETSIVNRDLCRDFTTEHGIVKIFPVEEILADRILASVYPTAGHEAHAEARLLMINGLSEAFQMDWAKLHSLCHRPEYRVGEELAQLRMAAKKDIDAVGTEVDPIGQPIDPEAVAGAATTKTPIQ